MRIHFYSERLHSEHLFNLNAKADAAAFRTTSMTAFREQEYDR
jgi:hypothetical protein